jgi:hypothetical protein
MIVLGSLVPSINDLENGELRDVAGRGECSGTNGLGGATDERPWWCVGGPADDLALVVQRIWRANSLSPAGAGLFEYDEDEKIVGIQDAGLAASFKAISINHIPVEYFFFPEPLGEMEQGGFSFEQERFAFDTAKSFIEWVTLTDTPDEIPTAAPKPQRW